MDRQAQKNIEKLERALGICFHKRSLLTAALAHPSYRNENPDVQLENFERLEFFGDAILNFVICQKLYDMFPEANEGTLSRLRSALVSRKILKRIAEDLKLLQFILLGRSELSRPKQEKSKILADSLESVIAAIFLDHGLRAVQGFLEKQFARYLNLRSLKRISTSAKTALQELSQKHFKTLPVYSSIQKGHDHFLTTVEIVTKGRSSAEGRTKKESEERAARKLLQILRKKEPGSKPQVASRM